MTAFLCSNLRLALFAVALGQLPGLFLVGPRAVLALLTGTAAAAFCSAVYYLRSERSHRFLYGVAYALYSLLSLQWILPWALLTVRDERWGTR